MYFGFPLFGKVLHEWLTSPRDKAVQPALDYSLHIISLLHYQYFGLSLSYIWRSCWKLQMTRAIIATITATNTDGITTLHGANTKNAPNKPLTTMVLIRNIVSGQFWNNSFDLFITFVFLSLIFFCHYQFWTFFFKGVKPQTNFVTVIECCMSLKDIVLEGLYVTSLRDCRQLHVSLPISYSRNV